MTASSQTLSGSLGAAPSHHTKYAVEAQVRPARIADIIPILALHREAFADKFGGAFGAENTELGMAALAAAWQRQGPLALRGMFVAEYDGNVIGTTTIRTREMTNEDSASAEIAFHEQLGVWRAVRSLFVLSLLDHSIQRREGFITDVAVHEAYRRGGIARAMLARAEQEALLRGKRFLGLYVSARNEAARNLYRDLGFYQVRSRRSLLAWIFFGQGHWIYMRKDL